MSNAWKNCVKMRIKILFEASIYTEYNSSPLQRLEVTLPRYPVQLSVFNIQCKMQYMRKGLVIIMCTEWGTYTSPDFAKNNSNFVPCYFVTNYIHISYNIMHSRQIHMTWKALHFTKVKSILCEAQKNSRNVFVFGEDDRLTKFSLGQSQFWPISNA